MATQAPKNQNSVNIFLNDYFNILLATALIIFLGLSYFVFISPKYQSTISTIKDSVSQKQILYNAQKKKYADLKAISDIYKKINPSDLKKFNNVLSDAYVKESLFGEIEDIVSQNGFLIDEISVSRPEDDKDAAAAQAEKATSTPQLAPNIGEIDINLSLSSIDYAGFKNLIKVFESNLRILDISKVNFSAADSTADLTLRTYYYKTK